MAEKIFPRRPTLESRIINPERNKAVIRPNNPSKSIILSPDDQEGYGSAMMDSSTCMMDIASVAMDVARLEPIVIEDTSYTDDIKEDNLADLMDRPVVGPDFDRFLLHNRLKVRAKTPVDATVKDPATGDMDDITYECLVCENVEGGIVYLARPHKRDVNSGKLLNYYHDLTRIGELDQEELRLADTDPLEWLVGATEKEELFFIERPAYADYAPNIDGRALIKRLCQGGMGELWVYLNLENYGREVTKIAKTVDPTQLPMAQAFLLRGAKILEDMQGKNRYAAKLIQVGTVENKTGEGAKKLACYITKYYETKPQDLLQEAVEDFLASVVETEKEINEKQDILQQSLEYFTSSLETGTGTSKELNPLQRAVGNFLISSVETDDEPFYDVDILGRAVTLQSNAMKDQMVYLHENRMSYRDFKLDNIVFEEVREGVYESRMIDPDTLLTHDESRILDEFIGTPGSAEPDQFDTAAYGNQVMGMLEAARLDTETEGDDFSAGAAHKEVISYLFRKLDNPENLKKYPKVDWHSRLSEAYQKFTFSPIIEITEEHKKELEFLREKNIELGNKYGHSMGLLDDGIFDIIEELCDVRVNRPPMERVIAEYFSGRQSILGVEDVEVPTPDLSGITTNIYRKDNNEKGIDAKDSLPYDPEDINICLARKALGIVDHLQELKDNDEMYLLIKHTPGEIILTNKMKLDDAKRTGYTDFNHNFIDPEALMTYFAPIVKAQFTEDEELKKKLMDDAPRVDHEFECGVTSLATCILYEMAGKLDVEITGTSRLGKGGWKSIEREWIKTLQSKDFYSLRKKKEEIHDKLEESYAKSEGLIAEYNKISSVDAQSKELTRLAKENKSIAVDVELYGIELAEIDVDMDAMFEEIRDKEPVLYLMNQRQDLLENVKKANEVKTLYDPEFMELIEEGLAVRRNRSGYTTQTYVTKDEQGKKVKAERIGLKERLESILNRKSPTPAPPPVTTGYVMSVGRSSPDIVSAKQERNPPDDSAKFTKSVTQRCQATPASDGSVYVKLKN